MDFVTSLLASFLYIFFIIDPFYSLPIFAVMTRKFNDAEAKKAARDSVLIAGIIAVVFLFWGSLILSFMGITLESFKVAGGIILALFGIETVLGIKIGKGKADEKQVVTTLIATPILTGPGLITALIIMSKEIGYVEPLLGILLALFISWLMLDNAKKVVKLLGYGVIDILAKVLGLFLVAIGVSLMMGGLGL